MNGSRPPPFPCPSSSGPSAGWLPGLLFHLAFAPRGGNSPSGSRSGGRSRELTREGAAARGAAHAAGPLPATQGLRRGGGGARRGERRLLTGGACALGALIVPRSCRTARLPARRPFGGVSRRESQSGGGCGARGRFRGFISLPVSLVPTRSAFAPHPGSVTLPPPTLKTRMPCPEQPSST